MTQSTIQSNLGSNVDWQSWVKTHISRVEVALNHNLPEKAVNPERLHSAMSYAINAGGKRIRPLLVYATYELKAPANAGVSAVTLDQAAAALEMLHTYSLVHDDLPSMDNDDLRRGKPTTHKAFDEATALLVGDALQTQAFGILANLDTSAQTRIDLVKELASASGSLGMAGGQAIDLQSVGTALDRPALEMMHRMKTGALLVACVRMGAILAELNHSQKESLDRFAKAIGLGFQVVDDILDVTQNSQVLGKTAGKDAQADKPTFVSLMGLEGAKGFAQELNQQAIDSLSGWGQEADALRQIAHWVIARQH